MVTLFSPFLSLSFFLSLFLFQFVSEFTINFDLYSHAVGKTGMNGKINPVVNIKNSLLILISNMYTKLFIRSFRTGLNMVSMQNDRLERPTDIYLADMPSR